MRFHEVYHDQSFSTVSGFGAYGVVALFAAKVPFARRTGSGQDRLRSGFRSFVGSLAVTVSFAWDIMGPTPEFTLSLGKLRLRLRLDFRSWFQALALATGAAACTASAACAAGRGRRGFTLLGGFLES